MNQRFQKEPSSTGKSSATSNRSAAANLLVWFVTGGKLSRDPSLQIHAYGHVAGHGKLLWRDAQRNSGEQGMKFAAQPGRLTAARLDELRYASHAFAEVTFKAPKLLREG